MKSGSEIGVKETLKFYDFVFPSYKTLNELGCSATMAASNDFQRIKRMVKASNPYRKTVICQILVASVVIYFWYSFNEGEYLAYMLSTEEMFMSMLF